MNNIRLEFIEFEKRSGLPARTTKEVLQGLGARCFLGESYQQYGSHNQVQQMQYQRGENLYLWKRTGSIENINEKTFEIHLEVGPNGYKYFPTAEEIPNQPSVA